MFVFRSIVDDEPGSRRSGTMSLREQVLSFGQLETLKMEDIGITLEARPRDGDVVVETDFADIIVWITNQLGKSSSRTSSACPIPFLRVSPRECGV